MEVEIRPEPAPEEREAILCALEAQLRASRPPAYRSAWREQGVLENVDDATDEERSFET